MFVEDKCTNDAHRYNVIIIGAGLSGLYAASILKDHGINDYCVLEARDRVGGRLLTKKDSKVGYVDLGGSYVGPSQFYIQKLIKKFNIKTYKINASQGKSVYLNQKRRFVHLGDRLPSLSNKLVELEIKNILKLMEKMSEELSRDEPWKHPQAKEWDQQTLGQFLDKHCWSQEAKDFISIYIGCCTSGEIYEESLLWTLWFIKQCDGLDVMYNVDDCAQDSKLIGGTQQLCERLHTYIGLDKIRFEHPVIELKINNNVKKVESSDYQVQIKTLNGERFQCRYVIIAIPPCLWQKIHFNPSLPSLHTQMLQKFTMGTCIKCIVYYREAFWRQQSLNGNMLINLPSVEGPITLTMDDTKPDGSYPAIVGFIIGDRARDILNRSKNERLKIICQSFARAFNNDEALKPIHYEEKNWIEEQYTGGAFTALGAPGFLTNYGELLQKPLFDCIFPAGTETSTHWAGYMDGALQSGERAALEILEKLEIKTINSKTQKLPLLKHQMVSSLDNNIFTKENDCRSSITTSFNLLNFNPSINQLLTWSGILVALFGSILMASF